MIIIMFFYLYELTSLNHIQTVQNAASLILTGIKAEITHHTRFFLPPLALCQIVDPL